MNDSSHFIDMSQIVQTLNHKHIIFPDDALLKESRAPLYKPESQHRQKHVDDILTRTKSRRFKLLQD